MKKVIIMAAVCALLLSGCQNGAEKEPSPESGNAESSVLIYERAESALETTEVRYGYNGKGLLAGKISTTSFAEGGKFGYRELYSYDEGGRMTELLRYDYGSEATESETAMSYDKNGNCILKEITSCENQYSEREKSEYDGQGRLVSYEYGSADGSWGYTTTYEYDEEADTVREKTVYENGYVLSASTVTKVREDGSYTETHSSNGEADWIAVYDGRGNQTAYYSCGMGEEILLYEYENTYDKDGRLVKKVVTDYGRDERGEASVTVYSYEYAGIENAPGEDVLQWTEEQRREGDAGREQYALDNARYSILGTWCFTHVYDDGESAMTFLDIIGDGTYVASMNTEKGENFVYRGNWSVERCAGEKEGYEYAVFFALESTDDKNFEGASSIGDFLFIPPAYSDGSGVLQMVQMNNGDSIYSRYYNEFEPVFLYNDAVG